MEEVLEGLVALVLAGVLESHISTGLWLKYTACMCRCLRMCMCPGSIRIRDVPMIHIVPI